MTKTSSSLKHYQITQTAVVWTSSTTGTGSPSDTVSRHQPVGNIDLAVVEQHGKKRNLERSRKNGYWVVSIGGRRDSLEVFLHRQPVQNWMKLTNRTSINKSNRPTLAVQKGCGRGVNYFFPCLSDNKTVTSVYHCCSILNQYSSLVTLDDIQPISSHQY